MSAAPSGENKNPNTCLRSLSLAVQESIESIIKKADYIKYDVIVKKFEGRGNFLGEIYEIDVNGETIDGKKETNIFVKKSIDWKNFRWIEATQLFPNEVMFYKELSKVIESLQDEANVPKEDRFKMAKAYEETNENAIILENLSLKGFKTYEKMEPTPFKYAELAVVELAKFHAFSFIIEKKMPEFYKNKLKTKYNLYTCNEYWKALSRKVCSHVASLCDGEAKKRFEKFAPTYYEKFENFHHDQTSVRCVLTHGDFKKNNLMVRLKDGEPEELIIVDYQLIDYGCPIKDLILFIFSGTDPEFRRKHTTELKEVYFKTLTRFLMYFDMDVETVYPRREYDTVWREWMSFALMSTLYISTFSFASYEGLDLDELILTEAPFSPDGNCDHIYRALVEDFIEWGVL